MADDSKGTPMMGLSMDGQTVQFVPRPYREMLAMEMAGGGGGGGGGRSVEDQIALMEAEYELKKKLLKAQAAGNSSWTKAIGDILGIGAKGYDIYSDYQRNNRSSGGNSGSGNGSFWSNWFSSSSGRDNNSSGSGSWWDSGSGVDSSKFDLDW